MLGEIIRKKRKEKNLSQNELSKQTELRTATISEFESGRRGINSKNLEKIMSILELKLTSDGNKNKRKR